MSKTLMVNVLTGDDLVNAVKLKVQPAGRSHVQEILDCLADVIFEATEAGEDVLELPGLGYVGDPDLVEQYLRQEQANIESQQKAAAEAKAVNETVQTSTTPKKAQARGKRVAKKVAPPKAPATPAAQKPVPQARKGPGKRVATRKPVSTE